MLKVVVVRPDAPIRAWASGRGTMRNVFPSSHNGVDLLGAEWGIISITECGHPVPFNVPALHLARVHSVLPMSFSDANIERYPKMEERGDVFGNVHAREMINYINGLPDNSALLVHCSADVSRSVAVARFVCEIQDMSPEVLIRNMTNKSQLPSGNPHVLNTLRSMWEILNAKHKYRVRVAQAYIMDAYIDVEARNEDEAKSLALEEAPDVSMKLQDAYGDPEAVECHLLTG
jgi:predicted protein tyrosine phosphatase